MTAPLTDPKQIDWSKLTWDDLQAITADMRNSFDVRIEATRRIMCGLNEDGTLRSMPRPKYTMYSQSPIGAGRM